MKQLTLEQLACYLPYKLRIKYWDRNVVMNAGQGSSTHWIGITALLQRQDKVECLPYMRDLSSITKPIKVEGYNNNEEFVPSKELHKHRPNDLIDIVYLCSMNYLELDHWPYWAIKLLIKWHFAIDIDESLYIKLED